MTASLPTFLLGCGRGSSLTCTQVRVKGAAAVSIPEQRPGGPSDTAVRILDVAERLLQSRGYNGFSFADVAAELGITRAALHYHFPSKAELGRALIERYANRFTAALAALDTAVPEAPARLAGYVEIYRDVLSADRMCLCGMLAAEYRTLPGPLQERVWAFFDRNTAWLTATLARGAEEGTLRVHGEARDAAAMVLGGLEGALLLARLDGDVARFSAAAECLLEGLRPAKDVAGLG
jgi:TetR/AcrR family transcriptional regulator, transcriptional repressor for nem operon